VKARRLRRDFYDRATLTVARDLIGKVLVHQRPEGRSSGVIVETEAYIGEADPACHAAPGPTRRNRPLYGPPGFSYVYLNYGIHFLTNVVTESEGAPAAVLLRALEPLEGISLMRARRSGTRAEPGGIAPLDLCRGPGNLSRALGITLSENWLDLEGDRLFLEDHGHTPGEIAWSPRIGIRVGTEHQWRCFAVASRAVSGRGGVPGQAGGRRPAAEVHDR
jgi:DNA-3-methyladenine glycosylase